MPRCLWLTVAALSLWLPAAGAAQAGWQEYTWKEAKCFFRLPGKPQKRSLPMPEGGTLYFWGVVQGKTLYMVAYADVPEARGEGPDAIRARFDAGRDKAVGKRKGKVIREKDLELDGYPGRECQAELPDGSVFRFRMYLVGGRLYQMLVAGPRGAVLGKESDRFLVSLKLSK